MARIISSEIQNHGFLPAEAKVQDAFVALAEEYGVGLVATNDFHYVNRDDADAQDIKVCIATGATLRYALSGNSLMTNFT